MSSETWKETFAEKKVTYVLEQKGRVVIVENVPARVSTASPVWLEPGRGGPR